MGLASASDYGMADVLCVVDDGWSHEGRREPKAYPKSGQAHFFYGKKLSASG